MRSRDDQREDYEEASAVAHQLLSELYGLLAYQALFPQLDELLTDSVQVDEKGNDGR